MTSNPRPGDRPAAWATAVGIGLITMMVAWLVARRLAHLFLDSPQASVLALLTAFVSSLVSTLISRRRLQRPPGVGTHPPTDGQGAAQAHTEPEGRQGRTRRDAETKATH